MKKRKSILTSIANLVSIMVSKNLKTRAMTVSQNPAIQIPTNQRTMKAKTILDAEKEEFRKALSSDATEENAQLKRQLSDLQTEYHEKLSKLENENDSLKESCRVLCNRCFALTRGVTCLFCGLDFPCPHMPGLEEQVAMAHKLRKEIEKNG